MSSFLVFLGCALAGPWFIKNGIDEIRSGEGWSELLPGGGKVYRNKAGKYKLYHRLLFWRSAMLDLAIGCLLIFVALVQVYQFFVGN